MRIRRCLGAFLFAASSVSAAQGPPSPPPLQDAERALVDALMRHDKPAFERLLAPDAVFFLPVKAQGPDAITREWLPFLVDMGVTMLLTVDDSVVGQTGDLAFSTGTFAFKGQTNRGPGTIPAGKYSVVWRLIDGAWKIGSLNGSGDANVRLTQRGGVGGFRFGMTRDEVIAVGDCRPYTNVAQTGGVECANYTFEGRKMNISFLFNADRLRRIQLWFYEGPSEKDAKEAVACVLDYLKRTAGGAAIGALPDVEVTPDLVMSMLNSKPPAPGTMTQFHIATPAGSQPEMWFSRVARHPGGYFVFLFADSRDGASAGPR